MGKVKVVTLFTTTVAMQNPGEAVMEVTRQQSVGALLSRVMARSKGMPIPFTAMTPVQNSGSGQGWTMLHDYPFDATGNQFYSVWAPTIGPILFCVGVCRYLRR